MNRKCPSFLDQRDYDFFCVYVSEFMQNVHILIGKGRHVLYVSSVLNDKNQFTYGVNYMLVKES